jgi:2-hydroxychromene-2-carboxylate isomerase
VAHIDYYFSLISPWTYLGSRRLEQIAARHRATIRPFPVDLGRVFPISGGLPLAKRAPQRQAYRLMELARWRDFLKVPLNIHPKSFPANETQAAACVIATRLDNGDGKALELSHAIMHGVWAGEKNIADPETLREIIASVGLDADTTMKRAVQPDIAATREKDTEQAIALNVFGAPTYVIDGELFWGQDRLDFVERKLAGGK